MFSLKNGLTAGSAATKRRFVWKSSNTRYLQLYSMCAIPLILLIMFNYVPMFGVVMAFKRFSYSKGILGSDWIGFDNFKFLFQSGDFSRIVFNTLYLNIIFIIIGVVCSLALALMMYEVKRKWQLKTYQTIFLIPNFLSWVIVAYMSYAILNPSYGFLNSILGLFGVEPIQWYSEPKYWRGILTIANCWKQCGMDSIMYFAALIGISQEYFEAARIDGANKKDIIIHIILPELASLITILVILKIGNIFRADFGLFYQITRNSGLLYSVADVIDTYVYRALTELNDVGMSSAVSLVQSVVGLAMVLLTNAIVKKIEPDNAVF